MVKSLDAKLCKCFDLNFIMKKIIVAENDGMEMYQHVKN